MSTNKEKNELILYKIESTNEDVKEIKETLKSMATKSERDMREIKEVFKTEYVTRAEFEPIKRIVFGVVSLFLVGIVTAILSLVIRQ